MDTSLFAPLDAANLQAQGLLGPIASTGSQVRRCHKRRLNRSSEEEYKDIPLDIKHDSPAATDAFETVPDSLISLETLLYLGLSTAKASQLWAIWSSWPSTGPRREVDAPGGGLQVSFQDFIVDRVENYQDAWVDNDDEWHATMILCGLSHDTRAAIMDPTFKTIRMTESCIFWVKETLRMRYAGLQEIQRASRERNRQIQRGASRPGPSDRGSGSSRGLSGQGQRGGSSQASSSQGRRSISGLQQANTPGISSEFWNSELALEARNKPNCIILYKRMDLARIHNLFDADAKLQNIESLLSAPPSDFSGTRSLFYFTPDYKVAEYYAAYAKRRARCESIVMVVLTFPKRVIDDLEEPELCRLYWGPRWKQLVWRSKLAKTLPPPLRKYRNALLIIGHTSRGAKEKFESMETWESVTEDFVLYVPPPSNGNMAVQYVFSGEEEGREFLTEYGKFDVFRFSDKDVEALLRRYN